MSKRYILSVKETIHSLLTLIVIFVVVSWFQSTMEKYSQVLSLRDARVVTPTAEVVAFGDSLIEGIGAPPGMGFVDLLSERLELPIINSGVSGDTSVDGMARLEQDVLAHNPKLVIVSLGGNDYLTPESTTELLFDNLREIIDQIQGIGSEVLILGVRGGISEPEYLPYYVDLAFDTKVKIIPDVLDGILFNPSLLSDPIHPNERGHALIADRLAPVLSDVLTELAIEHTPYVEPVSQDQDQS